MNKILKYSCLKGALVFATIVGLSFLIGDYLSGAMIGLLWGLSYVSIIEWSKEELDE